MRRDPAAGGGHLVGLRIALVLVELGEVGGGRIPQQDITIANNLFINLGNGTLPAAKRAAIWVTSSDAVHFNGNQFSNLQYNVNNPNENILRIEKTTNWTTDGNNCVSQFPGTWFTLICSPQTPPDEVTCDW